MASSKLSENDKEKLNEDNVTLEEIPTTYCPVLAISRLPYTMMRASHAENVASLFYESGKFWQRRWNIHCVFPDARLSKKPLLLVPGQQVEKLLGEIEEQCCCVDDNLIDKMWRKGFFVNFPDAENFKPINVGHCNSKDEFDTIRKEVAGLAKTNTPSNTYLSNNDDVKKFKNAVESAVNGSRISSQSSKGRKKDQTQRKQLWDRQSKRTERYLGLRPRKEKELALENDLSLSWSELQAAIAARDKAQELKPIDIDRIAPHKFEGSVIFIAVDVESYERNHNLVTEIGVATLDTSDIEQIPPGKNGRNWQSKIRARHIRVKEHADYHNSDFVNGCADRFEFGSSEIVPLIDTPKIVADCFRPPYSASNYPEDISTLHPNPQERNIVFVGHDPNVDIRYLQKLGYNPLQLSNLLEVIDTGTLDKVWKQHNQQRSLGNILYDLDMVSWHLHNAGNDAVYTLWAMIGVAIQNADLRATQGLNASSKTLRYEVMKTSENLSDLSDTEDSDDPNPPRKIGGKIGW